MPYQDFAEAVRGWWTYGGGDYCPECWKKFLDSLSDSVRRTLYLGARLLASPEFAATHKCCEGYCASCEICFKDISITVTQGRQHLKEKEVL